MEVGLRWAVASCQAMAVCNQPPPVLFNVSRHPDLAQYNFPEFPKLRILLFSKRGIRISKISFLKDRSWGPHLHARNHAHTRMHATQMLFYH